ncbi:hypothetical protein [Agromyces bauzanensis]
MGSIAKRRDRVAVALGAIVVAVGLCLTGCSVAGYDGVLARQIGDLKDLLMRSVSDLEKVGTEKDTFVDDVKTEGGAVPGAYWDRTSDPMALSLNEGGTVLYDLRDTGQGLVVFDVLLASGPRDAKADRFVGASEPYFGPPSIYTCFSITAEFQDDLFVDWSRDRGGSPAAGAGCDPELVDTLGPGASAEPVVEFDG